MFLSNKDPSRRVVPRWRSLSDFVDGRGLEQGDRSLFPLEEVELAFEKAVYGLTIEAFYTQLKNAFVLNPIGSDIVGELFEYKLTSNLKNNIDIPPMIIQPFVENAIIHGLQHKGEKGQLDLTVEENGRYLKVTIADNGIGRKAAQKYRKETHNSSAIKIVKDRIAKLDKWKLEEPITYIDLYSNDDAIGTKCILQIPK